MSEAVAAEKCLRGFCGETWRKETTWPIYA